MTIKSRHLAGRLILSVWVWVCHVGMLVRFFAVMLRCGGMLLSFLVPTLPMMMGRLSVVTCGGRLRAAT